MRQVGHGPCEAWRRRADRSSVDVVGGGTEARVGAYMALKAVIGVMTKILAKELKGTKALWLFILIMDMPPRFRYFLFPNLTEENIENNSCVFLKMGFIQKMFSHKTFSKC